jgi:hypothetical protein
MYRKISAVVAVVAVAGIAAALLAGGASARSAAKQQRIAIAIQPEAGTFVLKPLSTGPVVRDSGKGNFCCWTSKDSTRDGQSIEVNNPTGTFTGKRGTFTWHERVTFVSSDNDYGVGESTWQIGHGTGVYKHLEGHGRDVLVLKSAENHFLAAKAEGLVDLGG